MHSAVLVRHSVGITQVNRKMSGSSHFGYASSITSGRLAITFLCGFSLIAIRGLSLIHCDVCGKGIHLESCNNHSSLENAQPAAGGNREDLLYENYANITYNLTSTTLPDLPERNWIKVSSHQVDYISIEFLDTLINATTASSIPTPSELARVTRLRSHCTFLGLGRG